MLLKKKPLNTPLLSPVAAAPKSTAILEILAVAGRPDVISFAGGLPSPAGFPVEAIKKASDWVLEHQGSRALQYSQAEGVPELRQALADYESSGGIPTSPEQIQIVTGSQQALDLVARSFLNVSKALPTQHLRGLLAKLFLGRGTRLLVESPTYLGALSAFNLCSPNYIEAPVDEFGLNPDKLGRNCRKVSVAYVMPTFANPTGLTIDESRREALAAKARQYDFWLIEDDPYGELWYDKRPPLSLRHYAPERTIHLGTLSKVLSPGLRLGYIVANPETLQIFTSFKQALDLHTPTFTQLVAAKVLNDGLLTNHIPTVRALYKGQCQAMLEALQEFMPDDPSISWTKPTGGMFIWLNLPRSIDSTQLLRETIEKKVAFVPSSAFYARKVQDNHARLSFVTVPPEKIREGVKILAQTIEKHL